MQTFQASWPVFSPIFKMKVSIWLAKHAECGERSVGLPNAKLFSPCKWIMCFILRAESQTFCAQNHKHSASILALTTPAE